MVSKTTLYLVALSCLGAGFLGGVIFSALRSTEVAVAVQAPAAQPQSQATSGDKELLQAITMLQQLLDKDPQNYEALVKLGHVYFDSGQHQQAISAYEKALAIDPSSANVWTDLGVMYRREQKPQKAVDCFSEANRRDPNHMASLFNWGLVLLNDLADRQGAIAVWEKALAINPMAAAPNGEMLANIVDSLKAVDTKPSASQ